MGTATVPAETEDDAPGVDREAALIEAAWRLNPHTFAQIASNGTWRPWRHLRLIGREIGAGVVQGNSRIIVNMPPGGGKSSLISKWTPTWFLDNWDDRRIIVASHGDELARYWGREVRNEIESNPHVRTRLRQDSQAANRWNTPAGGGMFTAGVGTGVTGFRGNLIIVDDPHASWKEVWSLAHRRTVYEWFTGTLNDRLEPGGSIVILMHRWHEDDLTGQLLAKHPDRWKVITIPALSEEIVDNNGRRMLIPDSLGRTKPGVPYEPARFTARQLNETRVDVTDNVWYPKFQQRVLGVGTNRVWYRYIPEQNDRRDLRLRDDLPLQITLDFNANPGMHLVIGQYDPATDVGFAIAEVHGPYMKLEACLTRFIEWVEERFGSSSFPFPALEVFGDASGTQERAEVTLTAWKQVRNRLGQYMARHRKALRVKVPARNPPQRTQIDTLNQAIRDDGGGVHYYVNPDQCPRLAADLKLLKTDAKGLIDKSDELLSHASQAEAYRFCYIRPIPDEVPKTAKREGPVRAGSSSGASNVTTVVASRPVHGVRMKAVRVGTQQNPNERFRSQ